VRDPYRFLSRKELAKLELNFNRKTDGGPQEPLASRLLFATSQKRRPAMKEDTWNAISTDGRIVKYGYKELSDGVAGISAKRNGRFLMILQRSIRAPLTRKEVEAVFEQTYEWCNRPFKAANFRARNHWPS
jgi:hypothetical protein